MNHRACRVGTYLTDALGLHKGDVLTLICRNRVEAIDLYLACGKLGIILAPLSQRLKKPELDDLMARLQPRVLVHEQPFAELISTLSVPASVQSVINIDDDQNFFENVILKTDPREVNMPLAMNDRCLYVHTGGTTAAPKICIVSYRQMIWNSVDILATGLAGSYQKVLITFPFFHIGGWNTFTPLFHAGITSVLLREFNAGLILDLIHEGRVENFGAVEAMLQFLIAHPKFESTDFSQLKAITTAAAPCSKAVMQTFLDKGIPISQTYGMTEAGPSILLISPAPMLWTSCWRIRRASALPCFIAMPKLLIRNPGAKSRPVNWVFCVCAARITLTAISMIRRGPRPSSIRMAGFIRETWLCRIRTA